MRPKVRRFAKGRHSGCGHAPNGNPAAALRALESGWAHRLKCGSLPAKAHSLAFKDRRSLRPGCLLICIR